VEFTDANTGWAVGLGGTILHTINGATTWTRQTSGTTQQLLGVEFLDVKFPRQSLRTVSHFARFGPTHLGRSDGGYRKSGSFLAFWVLEILHVDPGTVALCVDDDRGRRFRDSGRADHLDVQEPTVLGKYEQFRQRPFIATERPVICGYRRFEQMRQERVVRGLLTRRTSVAAKSLLGQATDLFDLIGRDDRCIGHGAEGGVYERWAGGAVPGNWCSRRSARSHWRHQFG